MDGVLGFLTMIMALLVIAGIAFLITLFLDQQ